MCSSLLASDLAGGATAPPPTLEDLPDEVVDLVGRFALSNSPRDVLRLRCVCSGVRNKCGSVRELAEARRLRWRVSDDWRWRVSNHGRTITVVGRSADVELWATGGLLPRTGASTWAVRVDHSRSNDGNGLWVGVCDTAARCSWGLFLLSGRMRCASQDADGRLDFGAAPPDGYPSGTYKRVLQSGCLARAGAAGAVVEVTLDHDAGSLSFRVNGGQRLQALPLRDEDLRRHARGREDQPRAFPTGAALRPYASCYYPGDQLSFAAAFVA